MGKFPFYQQLDAMDCGPTCLRMIAKHYGRHKSGFCEIPSEKSNFSKSINSEIQSNLLIISKNKKSTDCKTYG